MKFQALAAVAVVALLCWPTPASAQQQPMTLRIQNGLVTLKAQNATIPQILAEWARVGNTVIVNGDHIPGPPVTLELANVPERQALDILLRSVSGYMLTARQAGSMGVSAFDRIFILPTSNPPRAVAPVNAAARPFVPAPPVAVEMEPTDPTDAAENPRQPPAPQLAVPSGGRVAFPIPGRVAPNGAAAVQPADSLPPVIAQPTDNDTGAPEPANQPGAVQTTPGNPFGVPFGSSATPGVIAPAPAQPTQQQQQQR